MKNINALAWEEYNRVLDKYHSIYKVKNYDRVSVHDAFSEIKKAFDAVQYTRCWTQEV